jgi:DNA-directed RNA polymerase subunit omega
MVRHVGATQDRENASLNVETLNQAKERINNIPLLVNVVSKRVRQLNSGQRPMIKPERNMSNMDIALAEVALGKLTAEVAFSPAARPEGDNLIQI